MSSTAPVRYQQPSDRETLSGSADWAFDNGVQTVFDPRGGSANRPLSQLRILALLLAVSPVTACPDPWSETQQRRSHFTMSSTFQASTRRRMTPASPTALMDFDAQVR